MKKDLLGSIEQWIAELDGKDTPMANVLQKLKRNIYERFSRMLSKRVRQLEKRQNVLFQVLQAPRYVSGDNTGFNGQLARKQIFCDLIATNCFDAIVETGTYTGDTTAFMRDASGLPVCSCEADEMFHACAKLRLTECDGIHLVLSDSRSFLQSLAAGELAEQRVFFYLDAHWSFDLPLREEIQIISECWKNFAILVDDFQVPGDDGYRYDRYGKKQVLSLALIQDLVGKFNLAPFFPSTPSTQETGAKRGSVVLTSSGNITNRAMMLASLTAHRRGILAKAG